MLSEQEPIIFPTSYDAPENGGLLSQRLLSSSPSSDSCSNQSADGVLIPRTCLDLYRNSISTDTLHDQNALEIQECQDYLSNSSTISTIRLHDQNNLEFEECHEYVSNLSTTDSLQQEVLISSTSSLSCEDSNLHGTFRQDLEVPGLQCSLDSHTLVNNSGLVQVKKKNAYLLEDLHFEEPKEKNQVGCLLEELLSEGPIEKKQDACLLEEPHLEKLIAKKQNVFVWEKRKEKKKQDVCLVDNREFVEGKKQDRCPLYKQHSEVPIEKKQGACLPEELHLEELIAKKQNLFARKKRKNKTKQDVCLVNNREFVEAKKQDRCPVDEQHSKVPIEKKQGACLLEELHLEELIAKKQNVFVRKKGKGKEKKKQDVCLINNREFVEAKKQDRCPLDEQHFEIPIEKKQGACLQEELHLEELIAKKQNEFVRKKSKKKKKQDICLVNNREFVEGKKQDICPLDEQHSEVPIEKKQDVCLLEERHFKEPVAKKQNVRLLGELHFEAQIAKKQDVCLPEELHFEEPIEKKQGVCLQGDLHSEEPIEEEVIKGVVAKERWIKHYSSFQKILLVGEGDFSFSASLANAFSSASNMIATSLDSRDAVIRKYKNAKSNLEILEQLGACILHGVDATKMKLHTDLRMRKFDRIIFNFPHAGFHGKEDDPQLIMKHRNLVHGFFKNSCSMLRADGEVHVNHKTTPPFCNWNVGELAGMNSLLLTECVDFKIQDYPGYRNKRGDGSRCDEPFPLGKSSTFKFRFSGSIMRMVGLKNRGPVHIGFQKSQEKFADGQQMPILLNRQSSLTSITFRNVTSWNHVLPMHVNTRDECSRIFGGYFDHVVKTFGRTDYDVSRHVREALWLGYERYNAEDPGRPLHDYISILEELHHISILRSTWLRTMLESSDLQS